MTFKKYVINGECVPKGRPRFNPKTGRTYTPTETRRYENHVYQSLVAQGAKRHDGGVEIKMTVIKEPPQSWSKKRQQAAIEGKILATQRPDVDNYVKSVLDGSKDLLFQDDSYVVSLKASKRFGDDPRVEIKVYELDRETAYG